MDKVEITQLLESNIECIKLPKNYKSIINMNNNLGRFDFVNRILIFIQDSEAVDTRTLQEWEIIDRDIKPNAKCIYTIVTSENNVYIDTLTNKQIGNDDLTVSEIPFALKYNIIKRENESNSINIVKLYDVKQTVTSNEERNNLKRFSLSTSKLLELTRNILKCNIVNSEMNYYSKSTNTLNICKASYKDIANTVTDLIVNYFIDNRNNTSDSEKELELIKNTLTFSLQTLFGVEADVDFDVLRKLDINSIIDALGVNDDFIEYIMSYIEYDDNEIAISSNSGISRIKKAVFILDLMEANEAYRSIRS